MDDSAIVAFLLSDDEDNDFHSLMYDFTENLRIEDSQDSKKLKRSKEKDQEFNYFFISPSIQKSSRRKNKSKRNGKSSQPQTSNEEKKLEFIISEEELFGNSDGVSKRGKKRIGKNPKGIQEEQVLIFEEPLKSEKKPKTRGKRLEAIKNNDKKSKVSGDKHIDPFNTNQNKDSITKSKSRRGTFRSEQDEQRFNKQAQSKKLSSSRYKDSRRWKNERSNLDQSLDQNLRPTSKSKSKTELKVESRPEMEPEPKGKNQSNHNHNIKDDIKKKKKQKRGKEGIVRAK